MAWWHWVVLAVIALLVFGGRGKLSGIMGDAGKGIKAFREGLKEGDKPEGAADAAKPTPLPAPSVEKDPIVR